MTGIDAIYISSNSFVVLGNLSDIFVSPIKIRADCGIDGLKFGNVLSSSWSDGTTMVILTEDSDNLTENLQFIWYEIQPFMDDGRPVVRADTRPLNTQTYFTDAGDDSTSIGGGIKLLWDFSNIEKLILICIFSPLNKKSTSLSPADLCKIFNVLEYFLFNLYFLIVSSGSFLYSV